MDLEKLTNKSREALVNAQQLAVAGNNSELKALHLLGALVRQEESEPDGILRICMAGFRLKNTLSEFGSVTRGICQVEAGRLTGVTETREIFKVPGGAETRQNGQIRALDPENLVSMNMWGLTPAFVDTLSSGFSQFLAGEGGGNLKAEYLLPELIDRMLKEDRLSVDVLESPDEWFGMTYQEDRAAVSQALLGLTEAGYYPKGLYKD